MRSSSFAALILVGVIAAPAARAADPAPSANAPPPSAPLVKDGIVGADVTSDRNRSGPDGWSWAPTTRNQSFSGKAPGETEASVHDTPSAKPDAAGKPDDSSTKKLAPGDDPGTPLTANADKPSMAGQSATSH